MTPEAIAQAAQDLFRSEKTQQQIGLLTIANPDMGMDDAYAVQKALVVLKIADGRRVMGWKVLLTSKAMQYALNINIPDSDILFDDMHFTDGSTVPKGRFIQPRIEAEIVFEIKAELNDAATCAKVLEATDYVCPSLEILDTRFLRADPKSGQTRKIFDTISDNVANAGIVLGAQRHDPNAIDLRWAGAICTRHGEVEETGLGAGVLNDPVTGIAWLSKLLEAYGQTIRAGDVVLSGSFICPVEARPGDSFHADFGSFGNVSIDFAKGRNGPGDQKNPGHEGLSKVSREGIVSCNTAPTRGTLNLMRGWQNLDQTAKRYPPFSVTSKHAWLGSGSIFCRRR